MHSNHKLHRLMMLMVLFIMASTVKGQDTSAINPWIELRRLETGFEDTIALSFKITAFVEVNPGTPTATRDSTGGSGKLFNSKFWSWVDSTETIQNDVYNLTLYHKDSVAVLTNAIPTARNIFQTAIKDPVFNRLFVQNITAYDSSGRRKISFQFKPESLYRRYDILFDTATYRIYSIISETSQSSNVYRATLYCTNYVVGGFQDSFFSMDKYFTRQQGMYTMVGPYATYELINSLKQ